MQDSGSPDVEDVVETPPDVPADVEESAIDGHTIVQLLGEAPEDATVHIQVVGEAPKEILVNAKAT